MDTLGLLVKWTLPLTREDLGVPWGSRAEPRERQRRLLQQRLPLLLGQLGQRPQLLL